MKISEVIEELQKIEQKQGDKAFKVYLSYSKITHEPTEVIFDEGEDDVYVGVYA